MSKKLSYKLNPIEFIKNKLEHHTIDQKVKQEILKVIKYMAKTNNSLMENIEELHSDYYQKLRNVESLHQVVERQLQYHLEHNRHIPRHIIMDPDTFTNYVEELELTLKQTSNSGDARKALRQGRLVIDYQGIQVNVTSSMDVLGIAVLDRKVNTGDRFPLLIN